MPVPRSRFSVVSVLVCILCSWPVSTSAESPPLPKINVVFVTPSDVEPPADVVDRLTEVADYTENFLNRWMTKWGYEPQRKLIFERTADGKLHVLFFKGSQTLESGTYNKPGFQTEVWPKMNAQHKLGRHRHVWWMWVYLGDPPLRFQGFRGGGDARGGGNALVNYYHARGKIELNDSFGSPFLKDFALKGTIHELGHALGLPHIGPLERDDLGMTLMGANIPNFQRKTRSRERRGYLSPAAAAMLWKHPIFSGTAEGRQKVPSVKISDLKIAPGRARRLLVTGKLESNETAHSIVVLDSAPNVHEKYWQKSYVGKVEAGGEFSIEISEPSAAPGTLKFLLCFNNGAVTGDGKILGLGGSFNREYRVNSRGYVLSSP